MVGRFVRDEGVVSSNLSTPTSNISVMRFIKNLLNDWKISREQEDAARRALDKKFENFLNETRPLTPKAEKYPTAALYRHTWKRAVVLGTEDDHVVSLGRVYQSHCLLGCAPTSVLQR